MNTDSTPIQRATLEDLARAERQLKDLVERDADYRGNNPDKFTSGLRMLTAERDRLLADLKDQGLIPETDEEVLTRTLDAVFPDARSRQVVTHEGRKYRKRFRPAEYSRSGKSVNRWEHWWEPVDGD